MRLIFVLLLIPSLLFAGSIQQQHSAVISKMGGGGCDTVLYSNTTATEADMDINDGSGFKYVGNSFTPAGAETICKATFYVSYKTGDISAKTFRAYLCTVTGNDLNVLTEADSTVTGSNAWSDTPIDFEWSAGYSVSGSTEYVIIITMGATGVEDSDGSNYAELEYSTSTAFPSGVLSRYSADKSRNGTVSGSLGRVILYTE